jgi:hypothetical protein
MELGSYFLFLQEQIKDIIISGAVVEEQIKDSIIICLSAAPACVCGRGAATWGCPRRRLSLPCRRDSPAPFYRTNGGWLSFGWL